MDTFTSSSAIGGITIMLLFIYGIMRILEYYGIGIDKYGSYLVFYMFLFISLYILPTKYSNISDNL
jgi:hypothetical protein